MPSIGIAPMSIPAMLVSAVAPWCMCICARATPGVSTSASTRNVRSIVVIVCLRPQPGDVRPERGHVVRGEVSLERRHPERRVLEEERRETIAPEARAHAVLDPLAELGAVAHEVGEV